MSGDAGDKSTEMLGRINQQLRQALLGCFPTAYEQYVTLQLPGTIIDTRLGGSYLPKGERATADIRNMIQCNEAMLVDSMVPLDKIMLGPTGKSVTRSYMTALDMLVPRKTEIGSMDIDSELSGDSTSRYSQAMKFLRSKETILTPKSEIVGSRLRSAKDKMEAQGVSGTVVDRYVEKQIAWSEARGKWDAVRVEAQEARESNDENLQSAALFTARQKDLKRTQGELHARWMDWVVNGDKFRVEYCFSVVDRDSIMARIERGREATRDSLLTSIDGTEWAQVTLEPRNWAQICRAKAIDWKTRNPTNPAHLQLRLESLKRMKQAYEVYQENLKVRGTPREPKTTWDAISTQYKGLTDEKARRRIEPLYNAMSKVNQAQEDFTQKETDNQTANAGTDKTLQDTTLKALNAARETLRNAKDAAAREEDAAGVKAEQEDERRTALNDFYSCEQDLRNATEEAEKDPKDSAKQQAVATARNKLDVAKTRWKRADEALQALGTKESVSKLEVDGMRTMENTVKGQITSINSEISELQMSLGATGAGLANAPNVITGVSKENALTYANDDASMKPGAATAALGEESADVWTKVAFSVGTSSDSSSTRESNVSASANISVGHWWAKVQASTSFSSSSKTVSSQMSSCRVDGSFSAMVVNIKRPWLHSELFQDFDIDIPAGTKLSPGAQQIKEWVDKGDRGNGANKRTEYGKFPAYPTAFIVAADTVLEFKSTQKNSEEMMKALSTDSSIQASYGPWGLKCGASAKTNSQESAQNMEVKDGSLRICFQAPQIIGWVSEILPELPRGGELGGLTAPPNKAFRA